ncbi:MAG: hypothetical protein OEQ18_17285, partial [Gammaproteobacteria bacterium]|nr:hypothetical protein [Gammaproteobacteria bacterium]
YTPGGRQREVGAEGGRRLPASPGAKQRWRLTTVLLGWADMEAGMPAFRAIRSASSRIPDLPIPMRKSLEVTQSGSQGSMDRAGAHG